MFTPTISENPVNDLHTHTLYLTTSAVNLLPIRRRLTSGKLKELVILPSELSSASNVLVLRVKHVALDFSTDFTANQIVPGSRVIGKMSSGDKRLGFSRHDKLMVFPYLTCWIQSASDPCANCTAAMAHDISTYSTHKLYPCTRNWQYGKTLDGGLQDYMRVPQPLHSVFKVPPGVSLHDCCFLFDIALPFYAYCRDVLLALLQQAPDSRILVILSDSSREANDCLLVIQHLRLDHLLITFTDMKKLNTTPGLLTAYTNKFHHVLVFAPGQESITTALALGIATGLETTKSRHTIALFGDNVGRIHSQPLDRTVYRVNLSYKDKLLMEELVHTLAELNTSNGDSHPTITHMQSLDSAETGTNHSTLSEHIADISDLYSEWSTSRAKKKLRFKGDTEVVASRPPTRDHISWLHCDRDFRLCLDDHCDHDTLKRCHSTNVVNRLLLGKTDLHRVFYTNRPASHVKINAFIF